MTHGIKVSSHFHCVGIYIKCIIILMLRAVACLKFSTLTSAALSKHKRELLLVRALYVLYIYIT